MMRKLITFLLILLLLSGTVLAAGGSPKIVDDAFLLDDGSEAYLTQQAEHIADTYGVDVVIVTVDSIGASSAQDYADDYFDYNGYGIGPDYSGILLLISMEYREWAISTCGDCIRIFSDRDLDDLFDSMSYQLSSGNYTEAFGAYLDALEAQLRNDPSKDETSPGFLSRLLIALVIGAAAGGITIGVMRSKMNTAKRQSGATDYLVNDSFHLYRQQDLFLYSRTSKTRKQQNSSGGSVHRGSSGRSHGGRSGRF